MTEWSIYLITRLDVIWWAALAFTVAIPAILLIVDDIVACDNYKRGSFTWSVAFSRVVVWVACLSVVIVMPDSSEFLLMVDADGKTGGLGDGNYVEEWKTEMIGGDND